MTPPPRGTPHISAAAYRAEVDPDGGHLEQPTLTGTAPTRTGSTPRARTGPGGRPAKRTPAGAGTSRTKKTVTTAAPWLPPADAPSRGPWTVAVDWLGRPMLLNDERSGVFNPATMARVRSHKRRWEDAFVTVIKHLGVPPQKRVFVTCQTYYPDNRVPDLDGLAPSYKVILDSLVQSGVLPDDKRAFLPFGYYPLPPVTDGGPPRVVFVIYPLPDT